MMEQPEITGRSANTMQFMDAVKTCFKKSITISGRASRSEFWFFYLSSILAAVGLGVIDGLLGGVGISLLTLAFIPAGITACIRRLHDIGKSGWMILLFVIPLVNFVLFIMWFIVDAGQPHANQYGDVPTNMAE
ncbi:MAG: DUF805 domain-containing protein [Euryarchaeota archaeon]|jgi:uncharacterized membrane protein YhaH (DUF805 family)|nr:DUF805 domain-containing protein [Euryarchaeota archaeon]|tara:strand:- start:1410 stop:1811 length:402 start_codon:yes stop_codon:yes gene_type:complete